MKIIANFVRANVQNTWFMLLFVVLLSLSHVIMIIGSYRRSASLTVDVVVAIIVVVVLLISSPNWLVCASVPARLLWFGSLVELSQSIACFVYSINFICNAFITQTVVDFKLVDKFDWLPNRFKVVALGFRLIVRWGKGGEGGSM